MPVKWGLKLRRGWKNAQYALATMRRWRYVKYAPQMVNLHRGGRIKLSVHRLPGLQLVVGWCNIFPFGAKIHSVKHQPFGKNSIGGWRDDAKFDPGPLGSKDWQLIMDRVSFQSRRFSDPTSYIVLHGIGGPTYFRPWFAVHKTHLSTLQLFHPLKPNCWPWKLSYWKVLTHNVPLKESDNLLKLAELKRRLQRNWF